VANLKKGVGRGKCGGDGYMFSGEFSPGFDRAMKDTIAMFKGPQDGFFDKLLAILSEIESDSRFRQ
jgi:hypothetical protein